MGEAVIPGMNRTLAATVLTVALVAVPYGAWFFAGITGITQEGVRAVENVRHQAWIETRRMAVPLAEQLVGLRRYESERPFYHYQNLYHDVRSVQEDASIARSPLSRPPTNPFVRGYFQIDAAGKVTSPAINDDIADLNVGVPEGQFRLREMLQAMSVEILASSRTQEPHDRPEANIRLDWSRDGWRKMERANDLYLALSEGDGKGGEAPGGKDDGVDRPVTIGVGQFVWRTLTIDGSPAPVALRRVRTPSGVRVQGFVISPAEVQRRLDDIRSGTLGVYFVAGAPTRDDEAAAPVYDLPWWLKADLSKPLEAVRQVEADSRWTFRMQFAVSAFAAAIAGGCIIGLVWQSERMAKERSRFAALAAHELRTPLAGLQMYGEMLAEGLGDPARSKVYARRISDEAQRLGRVVSNVLGFSRLERGSLVVRLRSGDLAEAVSYCATRQAFELEKAGATLEMDIATDLPEVKFDQDAIGQIVQNLLDNAEKYSRGAEDRTIHVCLARQGAGVTLSVRDHGPGIEPEVLRDLFRPFARGLGAEAPAGIGLGLTVTQALVKAHGGRINGSNADGGGALFTVAFVV